MAKQVILDSGLTGWQAKLQSNYHTFEEFEHYCEIYNLHARLGYKTPKTAWKKNPLIQGGVRPDDFRKSKVLI